MSFKFGVRNSASAFDFSFVSAFLLSFVLLTLLPVSSFGQFPQMRRQQERIQASEKAAAAEADRKREEELNKGNKLLEPKKPVMNVDVQAIFSKADHNDFAEAKAKTSATVADGENLWLYLKFNGKLGDYVRAVRDADSGEVIHKLIVEMSPQADATVLNRYILSFSKEELAKQELKINLAPGFPGRNASTPLFIEVAASRPAGRWNTEFRLTNSVVTPRAMTDNLATATITLDLSKGSAAYAAMRDDYRSMMLRGSADKSRLPIPGSFYSLPVKLEITKQLSADGIEPVRFFFASDNWLENGVSVLNPQPFRKIFVAFTYRNADACHFGIAEGIQRFDLMASKFVWDRTSVTAGFPLDCDALN